MTDKPSTDAAEPLWRWAALARLFPAQLGAGQRGADIQGVSIDSRTLAPGDLFVALEAERDGHGYLPAALEAGAAAALVRPGTAAACPLLLAEDTLAGLALLGEAGRERMAGQRLAITGSSGKTTLRAWLEALLGHAGATHASAGSFNNHLGVPLTLARMPRDTRYGVFEVGTNHPGEIAPLSQQVRPQVALLLNVLPAHLGNFPGMEALVAEKLAISQGLAAGGVFVLPAAFKGRAPKGGFELLTFGEGGQVSGRGRATQDGMILAAHVCGRPLEVRLPFAGEHRLASALAALAALHALDPSLPEALAPHFASLGLPEGRGQVIRLGSLALVDDSYNANPVSVRLAIEAFMQRPGGRKLLLLGEMLELGEASAAAHAEAAEASGGADRVLSFGALFKDAPFASREAHYASAADLPLEAFVASLRPDDQLLVKGSNQVFWKPGFVARLAAEIRRQKPG